MRVARNRGFRACPELWELGGHSHGTVLPPPTVRRPPPVPPWPPPPTTTTTLAPPGPPPPPPPLHVPLEPPECNVRPLNLKVLPLPCDSDRYRNYLAHCTVG